MCAYSRIEQSTILYSIHKEIPVQLPGSSVLCNLRQMGSLRVGDTCAMVYLMLHHHHHHRLMFKSSRPTIHDCHTQADAAACSCSGNAYVIGCFLVAADPFLPVTTYLDTLEDRIGQRQRSETAISRWILLLEIISAPHTQTLSITHSLLSTDIPNTDS